jgi:hypothetical protein
VIQSKRFISLRTVGQPIDRIAFQTQASLQTITQDGIVFYQ